MKRLGKSVSATVTCRQFDSHWWFIQLQHRDSFMNTSTNIFFSWNETHFTTFAELFEVGNSEKIK